VYAPDLPGEPGRSNEEQLPFDTMDYVFWLQDVLAVLKIERINIVLSDAGHSLTGLAGEITDFLMQ